MPNISPAIIATVGLTLLSCASDNEVRIQRRELTSNQFTYDAGATAVGDRNTFPIILQSVGPGPVTLFDIQSGDEDHFVVLPTWAETDFDDDEDEKGRKPTLIDEVRTNDGKLFLEIDGHELRKKTGKEYTVYFVHGRDSLGQINI